MLTVHSKIKVLVRRRINYAYNPHLTERRDIGGLCSYQYCGYLVGTYYYAISPQIKF